MIDLGHWEFESDFDINDYFGFIYRITEKDTGKKYIGKKQFNFIRRVAVKGKKNKKTVTKESDWKTYTSSSVKLNEQIILKGKDNYKFEIVELFKGKGALHYAEVHYLIVENALREKFPNGERVYYNGNIPAVKFIPKDEL